MPGTRIYAPVSAVTAKVKIFKSILMTLMWKSDLGDTSENGFWVLDTFEMFPTIILEYLNYQLVLD